MSRVVDAHVQIWDPWSDELEFDGDFEPGPTVDAEELLREAHRAGVDLVLQVTPPWMGFDNRHAEQGARRHPGEIAIWARIDPEREDLEQELAGWSRDCAIAGIHISATAGQPRLDDARHERLFDGCAAVGLPVAVDAPGGTEAIARIAGEHPRLRLLVDHAGMRQGILEPNDWSALLDLGHFSNVSVKLSFLPQAVGHRRPGVDAARAIEALVWSFGSHRLLWGSNFPACRSVCSYEESIDAIAGCRTLWDGDKELILGGNWSRMFEPVLA